MQQQSWPHCRFSLWCISKTWRPALCEVLCRGIVQDSLLTVASSCVTCHVVESYKKVCSQWPCPVWCAMSWNHTGQSAHSSPHCVTCCIMESYKKVCSQRPTLCDVSTSSQLKFLLGFLVIRQTFLFFRAHFFKCIFIFIPCFPFDSNFSLKHKHWASQLDVSESLCWKRRIRGFLGSRGTFKLTQYLFPSSTWGDSFSLRLLPLLPRPEDSAGPNGETLQEWDGSGYFPGVESPGGEGYLSWYVNLSSKQFCLG